MHARNRWSVAGPLALALVLLGVSPAPADLWLTVTPAGNVGLKEAVAAQPPTVAVADYGSSGFEVALEISGFALSPRKTEAGPFVALTLPGEPVAGEIGSPGLPVIRRLFVAPPGAEVSVLVQTGPGYVAAVELPDMSLRLLPVQPPVEKIPGALESAPFVFDRAAYAQHRDCAPQRATISEVGIARGQRLFLLEIYPVNYNPATERVTFWTSMVVSVEMVGGQASRAAVSPPPGLASVVLNPSVVPQDSGRDSSDYLIVVAQAYESDITTFANYKSTEGYDVSTYVVPPGTSNTTIKSYIQSLWGGPDAPAYILLVGDTDTIPCWVGGGSGSPDTDLNYACVEGTDYLPDIAIGRFSVRSSAELQAVMEKTIDLESGNWADPEYALRACFMASYDNHDVSEGTHEYVITNYMDPNGIVSDRLYCYYGATTQDVRDAFNDGRVYGIYSGHGGSTSWADGPPFSQSDVNNLTNYQMYPFVCSFACSTGDFENYNECFTETWLRAADKAAAVIYGSSVSSYWTEDDILERRLFDVIYDADNPVREVSPAWQEGFLLYFAYFGDTSTTRRYMEMYNLMGDPSLYIPEPGGSADLRVMPLSDLQTEGMAGGPFDPNSITYTLSNNADVALDYEVSTAATWVTITDPSGTIPVDGSVEVTVAINEEADSFPNGHYEAVVDFVNTTNHDGDTTRMVILDVGRTIISVAPSYGLETGGPLGGPFTGSVTYTVTSERPTPVTVQVAASDSWISLDGGTDPLNFVLTGTGDSCDVVVGISSEAESLEVGIYNGVVDFTNVTSGEGDTQRNVLLEVGRVLYVPIDVPQPINDYTTITSTINVTDAYCVGDVNVDIDITHTYIGDLSVQLTNPGGVNVYLHNRSGGSTDDLVTTYDEQGGTMPDGPGSLADFNYAGVTGTWTLTVTDHAGGDQGTLNDWGLSIVPLGEACPPIAHDVDVTVPLVVVSGITLDAESIEGQPLTYIITTLPQHAILLDPNGGLVETVPYTLLAGGDTVMYNPDNDYAGSDTFAYMANDGEDSNEATVNVMVGGLQPIHVFNLDTDPGWPREGQWEFGQPSGGSHNGNPTSGHTGLNVYGYNIDGDYTNNMPQYSLTSNAIDCSDMTEVELRFWKWLGVEAATADHASVAVSNGSSFWITVWQHTGSAISDTAWSQMVLDISAVADNQANVSICWGMGPTDGSVTYPGWNIDDIEVWGVVPFGAPLGDLNCDGEVNGFDIDPFVLALIDPAAYQATYPECDWMLADCNEDGVVNAFDIDPFVALLSDG